jgi:small conductance mechanosensitive channel
MPKEFAQIDRWFDIVVAFLLTYSFQILGAVVILLVGLKLTGIGAKLMQDMLARNRVDITLSRFLANVLRLVLLAVLAVIVAGQFGINVTPLVAALGAATLGITVALQGVLSNYAAGVTIILTRPFRIGDTIGVRNVTGLVEDITLPATILRGDQDERITVPNRQIIGEILVNSAAFRIVDLKLPVTRRADVDRAIAALRTALDSRAKHDGAPPPQIGAHEFTDLGVVIGIRYWAPTKEYYAARYSVNEALRRALSDAGIDQAPG